jgi:exopolysaccharide biosynthesis polyprenyl glycosylphosphotransferase
VIANASESPQMSEYLLILGSAEQVRSLSEQKDWPRNGRPRVLGCVSLNGAHAPEQPVQIPILGNAESWSGYIFNNPVDIVLVSAPLSSAQAKEFLEPALQIGLTVAVPKGVGISLDPAVQRKLFTRHKTLLGLDTTLLSTVPQHRGYLFAKRVLDCVISGIALALLAPVFLIVALSIKFSSPAGPVFYRWHVLGKNGKPFVGYKFRTMVPQADQLKEQLLAFNEMQGPVFKMRNDPRVFPFGRFLRKFSIDELPQLYSVLKGDMSLVGPRPPSREEAERFEFWQRRKLSVKPGISCLWQVNGRNEIRDFSEWARLDLEYIQHASFLLDLKILLLTIPAVLSGQGAS